MDKADQIRKALLLDEKVHAKLVTTVLEKGYAPDLTDIEIEEIGRDPFLVAYAMAGADRCVVTTETSAPKKQRQNRKLPDVCETFDVKCYTPFKVNRDLGFKTDWNS